GDGHVGGHMAEDGRLNIVALVQPLWTARAADYQLGTFFDALGDQLLDLAPLGLGYDRANGGVRGVGRAGLDLGSDRLGNFDDLVHAAVGHQQAGRGVAGLAAVVRAGHDAVGNHLLEVDVVEQDIGRLAAQLQGHALDGLGAVLHDLAAGTGGTGKGHHVDIRVRGHGRTHGGAITIDQVEYPGRYAGFIQHFGQQQGRQRCHFGRLQHHGATGGQGRSNLAGQLVDRPVPGGDQPAHADWLLDHQGVTDALFEFEFLQRLQGGGEMAGAGGGLGVFGQLGRRAHFQGNRLRKVGAAALVDIQDTVQQDDAVFAAGRRVGLDGGTGGGDGGVDVLSVTQGDGRDHFLGGGIDHVYRAITLGRYPLAVDIGVLFVAH